MSVVHALAPISFHRILMQKSLYRYLEFAAYSMWEFDTYWSVKKGALHSIITVERAIALSQYILPEVD